MNGNEIAVIGMAGRFPGAEDIEAFWRNLKNGVNSIVTLDDGEMLAAGVDPLLLDHPDYVKVKGVLEDCDCFDAPFFNYTPREAAMMDPQLRVLHQCAFQALEHANIDCSDLRAPVGVFVGVGYNMYWLEYLFARKHTLSQQFEAGMLNDRDFAATLIAYKLNLTGPAVTMQTACSTSLTTIHFACQSLLAGECAMALAGGVSITIPTKSGYLFQEGMTHSPDGCCRAFDREANGTVFGDGVGMVVLKHLDDALEDRDCIHAVIKGSGMNNDGRRKVGYTAPGASGQAAAIGMALETAEVEAESIGYVEAHGTGTILGDPIEMEALKMVFPSNGQPYCAVGSVKTNVGHLNNASGVTGFIKTVLAIENRLIPPSLNFRSPNPALGLESSPFYINDTPREWQNNGTPLRAGVSSFGVGGTNVHMVLEEAPPLEEDHEAGPRAGDNGLWLLPVSARSGKALDRRLRQLADYLKERPALCLQQVAVTLQTGRQDFELRRIIVARSIDDAAGKLEKAAETGAQPAEETDCPVIFLFSGLGGERQEMGRQLEEAEPVFRETMERCRAILKDDFDPSLPQTMMLPFQIALSDLLRSWGIEPVGVMGYSFGEVAAAVTSGVLTLEEALRLVVSRSRAVASVGGGGMLSVPLDKERLLTLMPKSLSIAIDNGDSCVVAGPEVDIETLDLTMRQRRIMCVRVNVRHPLHTGAMAPAQRLLEPVVEELAARRPVIPWLSGLTGGWMGTGDEVEPDYWLRHMGQPMKVASCLEELARVKRVICIEIGPGRELAPLLLRRQPEEGSHTIRAFSLFPPVLKESEPYYMLAALGRCWQLGKSVDWKLLYDGEPPRSIPLPTYPFDKHRFPCDVLADKNVQPKAVASKHERPRVEERLEGIEGAMAAIWREYLGVEAVGIDDDFFDLGGDSLKASNVVAEIQRETGMLIPMDVMFKTPTIRSLSAFAREAEPRGYVELEAVEEREWYPLSSQQERLYVIHQLQPRGTGYNELAVLSLEGALDVDRLETAAKAMIQRHEALRTSFHMLESGPAQRIHQSVDFTIQRRTMECAAGQLPPLEPLVKDVVRPFDLERPPLLRMRLVALEMGRWLLLVDIHHIVSDGATIGVMVRELNRLYGGQTLEPPAVQYKEYAHWQRLERQTSGWRRQRDYWLDQFKNAPEPLRLPTDHPRPLVQDLDGQTEYLHVSPARAEALRSRCRQEGMTLFMGLLAVYSVWLWRLSGQDDLVVGTPVAGRRHSQLQGMVGMVVNTLALRLPPQGKKNVQFYLKEVKEMVRQALTHQDYPLEELVDEVVVERDAGRNPLFDVMFVLQEMKVETIHMEKLRLTPLAVTPPTARFDMVLGASVTEDDGLRLDLTYSRALFEPESVQRFFGYFSRILDTIAGGDDCLLREIEVMSHEERERLVIGMNDTTVDVPLQQNALELAFRQELDRVAVGCEDHQLTFGMFKTLACAVGRFLMERGIGEGSVVALMARSRPDAIAAIYGIWSVGAVYLPIDPSNPRERVQMMLQDSAAGLTLTEDSLASIPEGESFAPRLGLDAYIIYTSGTTGLPKGTVIRQRSVTNLCFWMKQQHQLNADDKGSQFASLAFDASVLEIFTNLAVGAPIYIVPPDARPDARKLCGFFDRQRISVAFLPPAVYLTVMKHALPSMRLLQVGGEALTGFCRHDYDLINIYGPTENTVMATSFHVTKMRPNIPIGNPLSNERIYIVEPGSLVLQPIGVAGELLVAGEGLAAGYLNRPELTAEKFVEIRFSKTEGPERCYRTGDLARRLANGTIEFLGRIDSQVKIRGFRIELGEIQHRLAAHPLVRQAAVVDRESRGGERTLCAYMVLSASAGEHSAESLEEELRGYLAKTLPEFMIPSFFTVLEALPLNASGKLDRRRLPEPVDNSAEGAVVSQGPRNRLEERMRTLWAEVLGLEEMGIGIDSHFFRLGGHSLKGAMLLAQVERELGTQIPLTHLFRFPTIRRLCEALQSMERSEAPAFIEAVEKMEVYPLSFNQRQLFFLEQMEGIGATYNIPFAMTIFGKPDLDLLDSSFKRLILRHDILRTSFFMLQNQPVQRVHLETDHLVSQWTMERMKADEADLDGIIDSFIRPFDLEKPPLLRVCAVQISEERHALLADIHHIAADGVSTALMIQEVSAYMTGEELEPLRIQYRDYALWQQRVGGDVNSHPHLDYWREVLKHPPQPVELPSMAKRPAARTFEGSYVDVEIPIPDMGEEATLFMRMMTCLGMLLFKYSGSSDFIVGTGVAGRRAAGTRELIGMFVNTLPVRLKPSPDMTVAECRKHVNAVSLEAFEHQDVPLDMMVRQLDIPRDPSRNPLFDVCLVVQNFDMPVLRWEGLRLQPISIGEKTAKFDLTVYVREGDGRLSCRLEYNRRLFDAASIGRLATHLKRLAEGAGDNEQRPLWQLDIMDEKEKRRIMRDFNAASQPVGVEAPLPRLFALQAEAHPHAVAIVETGSNLQLTAEEVMTRMSCRAAWLKEELDPRPEEIVAVMCERNGDWVVNLLAVMAAGCAYLPLEPSLPAKRRAMMIKDCGTRLVLASMSCRPQAVELQEEVEDVRISFFPKDERGGEPLTRLEHWNWGDAGDLAYVIFTSGSTGIPKGVLVEHRGFGNLGLFFKKELNITTADTILGFAKISFDASVWEVAMGLLTGASLVLPVPFEHCLTSINRYGVTVATLPPQLIHHLDPVGLAQSPLGTLVSAGSQLPAILVERLRQAVRLVNAYGPTETTICATWWPADGPLPMEGKVPIGSPIPNTRAFVLDTYLQLQPIGVAGELCLAGIGLARGYLNRQERTGEHFVHWETGDATLYRSGDLARFMEDGSIEFLGRIDRQVKIRGFRVECGEVEHHLMEYEDVRECVVVDRVDPAGEAYLCAYLVWEGDGAGEPPTGPLRLYLGGILPDYMVPAYFVALERVPLTTHGKLDSDALPDPIELGELVAVEEIVPRDGVERGVHDLWLDVLNRQAPIGIDRDFFQTGGHSLKASIMVERIHEAFHVRLPLARMFQTPTIRGIAEAIRESAPDLETEDIYPVEKRDYYPQAAAQQRLFFLDRVEGIGVSYNMPSAFTIEGPLDMDRLQGAFDTLAQRHESLRTYFCLHDDMPVQRVAPVVDVDMIVEDGESDPETLIRPFQLDRAPLWRVKLMRLAPLRHVLFFDMHHIIGDGTSIGVLVGELTAIYDGGELTPLKIQYRDFAHWQHRVSDSQRMGRQLDYWLDLLAGDIPRVTVPADFPRPAVMAFEGAHFEFRYDGSLDTGDGTLYMKLLAALNILLFKYSGQEDIIVGSGIAGRRHARLQHLVGMFVNALVTRNAPQSHKTVRSFSQEVAKEALQAFENQDVQFEALVEKLQLQRDPSRNPLFDVCLVVQNFELPPMRMGDLSIRPREFEIKTAKFDLSFYAREGKEGIDFNIEYATALFRRETIQRIARHFCRLLSVMEGYPDYPIGSVDILDEQERRRLLVDLNQTASQDTIEASVVELFTRQASLSPDRIAVGQQGNLQISYRQLAEEANRVARYLMDQEGGGSNPLVGVMLDNSIALACAVLGVLLSGSGFVFIDPDLPEGRQRVMIDDAALPLLISSKGYIRRLNRLQWECLSLKTFLCLDSMDARREPEEAESELMEEKLWEYVGETAEDDIEGGGWVSSFTGQPFTRREMDEYSGNIFQKLAPYCHKRAKVLEIGCASGITMFRLAPLVGRYVGCDLSRVIIEKNRERIAREGIDNVEVFGLPAHRIDELEEDEFDIIILNSVIQSFHGHNYLRRVVESVCGKMAANGILFIGDIMDVDLKDRMTADLLEFARKHPDNDVKTKTSWDAELFVSRRFLEDLAIRQPEIASCRFSEKIFTIANELTDYRFDALLTIDKSQKQDTRVQAPHKHQHDLRHVRDYPCSSVERSIPPQTPAYVIYTSGTSGNPKGVMVRHRSLSNYLVWALGQYSGPRLGIVPLYTNPAFDLTITSLFLPLISGRTLWAFAKGGDSLPVLQVLNMRRIDILKATPSHLSIFAEAARPLPRIDSLIVGGEELTGKLALELEALLGHRVAIFNEYGPTEATVGCMIHRFDAQSPHFSPRRGVPIGRPAANTAIYILDRDLNPVPINGIGELYIGGMCLADGYLNQPEMTAERFVDNPFAPGRMYRSGDLAVTREDGVMEFRGRADRQVKIRGHRIELLEVQNRIAAHPHIDDCVVTVTPDGGLCGYIVAGRPIAEEELRESLGLELPAYMIPAFIVQMERFPLTRNGKVDFKRLPEPVTGDESGAEGEEVLPQNEMEKELLEVWSGILGIANVPLTANFFQLGGDSIKVIQVASRLQKRGLGIEIKDFFLNPTIRDLAPLVKRFRAVAGQEEVTGTAPFTPIQHWFRENVTVAPHHYNQAVLLRRRGRLAEETIRRVFTVICRHHDALRMVIQDRDGDPVQKNSGVEGDTPFHLQYMECPTRLEAEKDILREAETIQASIDLAGGPLVKLGLFDSGDDSYLLICVHHLVMDGVSWRILLEDLVSLVEHFETDPYTEPQLPPKTHSYLHWARVLTDYSSSEALLRELPYWQEVADSSEQIPSQAPGLHPVHPTVAQSETVAFELAATETERLLTDVHNAYNTTVDDILLTATAMALCRWLECSRVSILLEGHGRQAVAEDVDINRTIGWFTTRFPVVLEVKAPDDTGGAVKRIKETLRGIPNKGIGYGVLRYLTPEGLVGEILDGPEPAVTFNYLGQVGEDTAGGFEFRPLPAQQSRDANQARTSMLEIDGLVESGILSMSISFHPSIFKRETIHRLAQLLEDSLRAVIRHCLQQEEQESTISDFSDNSMNEEDLLDIMDELEF
jgi:amino acid adenylation domain-containing protein/non-ribosomal peptide synthase protein (TIGR01720 family)